MDGLGRASGAPVVIQLGGSDYMMSALTLRDFGTIEQHLLTKRPNMLATVAEAVKDMPPEMAKMLMDKAYDDMKKGNTIPATEVAEWVDTFEGMVFSVWLALKKEHPDLTQDDVMTLMSQMTEDEVEGLKNMRDVASGLDELGNSTGPSEMATKGPGKKEAEPQDSLGESSTDLSPKEPTSARTR